jgi:hypothetical protein
MAKRGQTVEQKDRARKAVDLKIAGATWPQISEELGMQTEAGARLLVSRYFELTAKTQFEEMHPILLERAELLWRRAWTKLNQVQSNGSLDDWDKAMRQCVSVLQSLARISGLGNGPTINVNVTSTDDVRRLRDEFYELRGIAKPEIVEAEIIELQELNPKERNGSGIESNGTNNGLGGHD